MIFSSVSRTYKRQCSYVLISGNIPFSSVIALQALSNERRERLNTSWKLFGSLNNCHDGCFAKCCIGAETGVNGVGVNRNTSAVNFESCTAT